MHEYYIASAAITGPFDLATKVTCSYHTTETGGEAGSGVGGEAGNEAGSGTGTEAGGEAGSGTGTEAGGEVGSGL